MSDLSYRDVLGEYTEGAHSDPASRGHHPDSPSSLQASEACPCFENEQRESAAAAKGTLQHRAAETRDLSILHGDEEMISAVQRCIDYEDRIVEYFRTELKVDPVVRREKYIQVGDDIVQDSSGRKWKGVTGGFPDLVIYSLVAKEAHVPDWKYGAQPVAETKDNLQGWSYGLAVLQEFPQIERVYVHFFAPYQNWSEEEHNEKYIHGFTRADMPRMELRIRTVIARKHSANAKPSPKEDLCLWCAKKGDCPALLGKIIPVAGKYGEIEVPDIADPYKLTLPFHFASAHRFAGQVELWAKAVKKRCVDAVLDGLEIPGYKLVRRSDRTVQSVKAFREVAEKKGISRDEFEEHCTTVSIGKAEEFIKLRAGAGNGAAAVRQLASDLEDAGAVAKGTPIHFLKEIKTPAEKVIDV